VIFDEHSTLAAITKGKEKSETRTATAINLST